MKVTVAYGFWGNCYALYTKQVMDELLRTYRSKAMANFHKALRRDLERCLTKIREDKAMSERVSDARLMNWANECSKEAASMARELLDWRPLGESPEAVRAQIFDLQCEIEKLRARLGLSSADVPPPMRPTPLEALEREFAAAGWSTFVDAVHRARRAAGEVL